MENNVKKNIGDEYDERLRAALRMVLLEIGATPIDSAWGVGGTQELEVMKFRLGSELIIIESETFIGLSVEGPEPVVNFLESRIRELMGGERH